MSAVVIAAEIGDLLFQSYFLALLLSERGAGDLEGAGDVLRHGGEQRQGDGVAQNVIECALSRNVLAGLSDRRRR